VKTWFASNRSCSDRFEAGDTLAEVLLAMVIISITAVAILSSFATALGASAEETSLAQTNAYLKSYAEVVTAEIQENSPPLFTSCAVPSTYTKQLTGLPTNSIYTISMTSIQYWNPNASPSATFGASCVAGSTEPQLITLTATGPKVTAQTLSFVVSDFLYVAPPNVPPAFSVNSPFTLTEGQGAPWTYTLTTSAGSPTPALTVTSLPTGVTFTDLGNGTGTLVGTSAVAAGTYALTFTAANGVSPNATLSFNLVIASAPVFTSANTVSFAAGSKINFTISATDIDSQVPAFALDSTLTGPFKNLTFVDNGNGTGTLAGTLVSGTTGTFTLEFEADNSVGVATTQNLVITIPTAPVFTSATSVTWETASVVSFNVSATDTDTTAPTISLSSSLTGALANLHFVNNGNGSGTISGTLTGGSGAYPLIFQATNSAGQTTNQTLNVEVASLPVFTSANNASEKSGGSVNFTVSATDTDTAAPTLSLVSTLSGACKNLSFANKGNGTGTLSGTLVAGTGTCTLTFQATNSLGAVATQAFTVYIPTSPVFTSSASMSGIWDTAETYTISATDSSDVQSPSFALNTTLTGALSSFTFVDNGNGTATLRGTTTFTTGTYSLNITATNSAGVSTVQTLVITIRT
jgi:large repetitive protein